MRFNINVAISGFHREINKTRRKQTI